MIAMMMISPSNSQPAEACADEKFIWPRFYPNLKLVLLSPRIVVRTVVSEPTVGIARVVRRYRGDIKLSIVLEALDLSLAPFTLLPSLIFLLRL
jgi:hypothetical protein